MDFKLEHRYIVIKVEDARTLSTHYQDKLVEILTAVEQNRALVGKEPTRGVFISKNWPEYEPTVKLLGGRVLKEK